jgi:hypothetical protein
MDHLNRTEILSSKEDIKLNSPKKSSPDLTKTDQTENVVGSSVWYIVLSVYTILLSFTGGVTFFYNNGFASQEENIQNLNRMETEEQLELYTNLLKTEVNNMKNLNNIANQSFNVVLGSLLGFLSATLTAESSEKNNEDLENRVPTPEPQPDDLKE